MAWNVSVLTVICFFSRIALKTVDRDDLNVFKKVEITLTTYFNHITMPLMHEHYSRAQKTSRKIQAFTFLN